MVNFRKLQKTFNYEKWISSVHNKEPITVDHVLDQIRHLCKLGKLTFVVTLTHCMTAQCTHCNEYCVFFDNFFPATNCVNSDVMSKVKFAIQLPFKPSAPKNWADL